MRVATCQAPTITSPMPSPLKSPAAPTAMRSRQHRRRKGSRVGITVLKRRGSLTRDASVVIDVCSHMRDSTHVLAHSQAGIHTHISARTLARIHHRALAGTHACAERERERNRLQQSYNKAHSRSLTLTLTRLLPSPSIANPRLPSRADTFTGLATPPLSPKMTYTCDSIFTGNISLMRSGFRVAGLGFSANSVSSIQCSGIRNHQIRR